jgi:hypothetical protein
MGRPKKIKRSQPTQDVMDEINANPNIKDVVLNWSRRGGKSFTAAQDVILPFAYYLDSGKITYVSTTLKHAKDIMWTQLLDTLGPIIKSKNTGEGRITVHNNYGGESVVQLMGWQTIDSIRGTANDVVIYDETQLLGDFFANHNTAVMPTMATTKGRRFYLFTPYGFNHAYELAQEAKKNPEWIYSEADWTKFKHIDAEFVEKEKKRMTDAEFRQEYMCEFIKPDGLVLSEFKRDIHAYAGETDAVIYKRIVGVDFGYGQGKTAILKADVSKNPQGQDIYWINKEVYKRGSELQTYQIAKIIADMKPNLVHADSADPGRTNDLSRTGLPIMPIKKSNNYKTGPNGLISRVNQAIKQDRVHIHEDVVNLLSEINMWFWKGNGNGDIVRPDKSTKHDAIDAMLYLVGANEESVTPERVTQLKKKKKISKYKPVSV